MIMDKILTVGIPVYNVEEEYLKACLDSVVKEKAHQLEIIIVDDGSENNSADICKAYAEKDERIIFIGLEVNRGVSFARNTIIEQASGKWMCFLDADDLLCDGFYETVMKNENLNADVIYYNYKTVKGNETPVIKNAYVRPVPIRAHAVKNLCVCHLCAVPSSTGNMTLVAGVATKIFRLDYIKKNHLSFLEDLRKAEDRLFVVTALSSGGKVYFSEQYLYLYRIHQGSASRRFNKDILKTTDKYLEYSEEIINRTFKGNQSLRNLYLENRVTTALLDNFELNIFHKNNSASHAQRKREFLALIEKEPYKTAVESVKLENYMIREKRILLWNARKRNFFLLNLLYKYNIILRFISAGMNRYEKYALQMGKIIKRIIKVK